MKTFYDYGKEDYVLVNCKTMRKLFRGSYDDCYTYLDSHSRKGVIYNVIPFEKYSDLRRCAK